MVEQPAEARQAARALWTSGDYPTVAERLAPASRHVLEVLEIGPGDELLDVGCGTGNAAVPAAELGASVTGLDITPELLDKARARAEESGVEVRWVEGDAQGLPFDEESFDVVISVFGCMFAPDHRATAEEIVRVLRPGGRFGVTAWTPEGAMGRMFTITSSHMPAPPEDFDPPILWGDPGHVSSLFDGTGAKVEFERPAVRIESDSLDAAMAEVEETVPPVVAVRSFLEPQGKWPALRSELRAMYAELAGGGGDGAVAYDAEYLLTLGRKPG